MPTDNVVANIISDTTEDGSVALDDLGSTNYPFSTFTVRITPNGTTMRTISGTAAAGLITLNGADRVTIDGSGSGGGRYLTLRNTGTASTSSTILFRNDSSNNAVRNCVVEGPGTGYGINFGTGTLTGNNDNVVTNCVVRDRSDAAGVPSALINSSGFSGAPNTGNTISNNECFNFKTAGIFVGGANANWTVSGNNVYDIDPQTVFGGAAGIVMNADGTNLVTQNYVHDIKSGSTAPTGGVTGISVAGAENTAVTRNRIVLNSADPTNTTVTGIGNAGVAGQVVTVSNNQITIIPSLTLATQVRGISDNSAAGGSSTFAFNTVVVGGTASGAVNSWCLLRQNPDTFSARNNLFLNVRTGGTGSHFAMGSESLSGATGLAVSNNVYAGTGAVAASFMDFSGTPGTALPVSYAAWQSSTGDTSTSASNPGGDYSTAMFVDAANGDLHLVPGGNVLVNRNGTPIAGITTDYDGSTRHASTPFIGADEIPLADIALAQTAAVADGGSIDFGTVTPGSSSAAKTFTITNPGTAALTGLSITGATGDFTVSALSGTSIPVGNGSVTFTVTFTPATSGARTTTLHISSNVTGAKNPFDLTLTGTGQSLFQAWAAANSTVADSTTLMHFASGTLPGSNTALVYTGTFAGGGTISATGTPINTFEPAAGGAQYRVLFVRRKDYITAGLSYTPKFSADLTGWVNSADEPTVLADDGTHQIVSVPYPTLAGGTEAKFFQLVVSVAL